MTVKIQHFALFQSTLQNVSFVKHPGDKVGSKALNMFKYVAFLKVQSIIWLSFYKYNVLVEGIWFYQ